VRLVGYLKRYLLTVFMMLEGTFLLLMLWTFYRFFLNTSLQVQSARLVRTSLETGDFEGSTLATEGRPDDGTYNVPKHVILLVSDDYTYWCM
jgi:hypothetical protein